GMAGVRLRYRAGRLDHRWARSYPLRRHGGNRKSGNMHACWRHPRATWARNSGEYALWNRDRACIIRRTERRLQMIKSRFAAVLRGLALVAGLAALPGYVQAQATTLALPATAVHFTPIYIAADAGLWKARGLDVKLPLIAGPGATNAVIAGSADFASTAATSVLRAAARGQPMLVIATTHAEFLAEIVISKKAAEKIAFDPKADLATRVRSLKGMTLAIDAPLGLPHGFIKYLGSRAGIDADREFVLTPMQPPNMV